jgi:hypothetical protein
MSKITSEQLAWINRVAGSSLRGKDTQGTADLNKHLKDTGRGRDIASNEDANARKLAEKTREDTREKHQQQMYMHAELSVNQEKIENALADKYAPLPPAPPPVNPLAAPNIRQSQQKAIDKHIARTAAFNLIETERLAVKAEVEKEPEFTERKKQLAVQAKAKLKAAGNPNPNATDINNAVDAYVKGQVLRLTVEKMVTDKLKAKVTAEELTKGGDLSPEERQACYEKTVEEVHEEVETGFGATIPLAHFVSRHGKQVTEDDMIARVATGITPDDKPDPTTKVGDVNATTAFGKGVTVENFNKASNSPNPVSRTHSGAAGLYMMEEALGKAWEQLRLDKDSQDKRVAVDVGTETIEGEDFGKFSEPGKLGESWQVDSTQPTTVPSTSTTVPDKIKKRVEQTVKKENLEGGKVILDQDTTRGGFTAQTIYPQDEPEGSIEAFKRDGLGNKVPKLHPTHGTPLAGQFEKEDFNRDTARAKYTKKNLEKVATEKEGEATTKEGERDTAKLALDAKQEDLKKAKQTMEGELNKLGSPQKIETARAYIGKKAALAAAEAEASRVSEELKQLRTYQTEAAAKGKQVAEIVKLADEQLTAATTAVKNATDPQAAQKALAEAQAVKAQTDRAKKIVEEETAKIAKLVQETERAASWAGNAISSRKAEVNGAAASLSTMAGVNPADIDLLAKPVLDASKAADEAADEHAAAAAAALAARDAATEARRQHSAAVKGEATLLQEEVTAETTKLKDALTAALGGTAPEKERKAQLAAIKKAKLDEVAAARRYTGKTPAQVKDLRNADRLAAKEAFDQARYSMDAAQLAVNKASSADQAARAAELVARKADFAAAEKALRTAALAEQEAINTAAAQTKKDAQLKADKDKVEAARKKDAEALLAAEKEVEKLKKASAEAGVVKTAEEKVAALKGTVAGYDRKLKEMTTMAARVKAEADARAAVEQANLERAEADVEALAAEALAASSLAKSPVETAEIEVARKRKALADARVTLREAEQAKAKLQQQHDATKPGVDKLKSALTSRPAPTSGKKETPTEEKLLNAFTQLESDLAAAELARTNAANAVNLAASAKEQADKALETAKKG